MKTKLNSKAHEKSKILVLTEKCYFTDFHIMFPNKFIFLSETEMNPLIPTFHWTAFPLRSWRSRSFSKIIPNRSRSVDSQIWGLHASSTLPLCFYYASVSLLPRCSRFGCVVIALLLQSRYDNEDPATLMAMQLRACYDIGDGATLSLRFCVIFI